MKRYILIPCAVAAIAACTEDKYSAADYKVQSVGFSLKSQTTMYNMPTEQIHTVKVDKISSGLEGNVAAKVKVEWATIKDNDYGNRDLVAVTINGDPFAPDAEPKFFDFTLTADGSWSIPVTLTAANSTRLLRAKESARLRFTITSPEGKSKSEGVTIFRKEINIDIKGKSVIAKAPEYNVIEGRTLTDNVMWLVDTAYYRKTGNSPQASDFEFSASYGGNPVLEDKTLQVFGDTAVGIVIEPSDRAGWGSTYKDEFVLRLTQTAQGDESECKFKAKPDQMPLKAGTEFKTTTDKFHLLENKYVDVTDQNLRRFNLLYATMQKDGADSTRLTLTGADSCKFAVLPATAVEWGNANRIAAKGLTYGDLAAAPKKLPFAPDEYIKVDDYDYYAIKVVTYKLVPTLDADDKQVVVNNKPVFHIEDAVYYGYLRVRTMMSLYHQGDTPKFSHVAFDFKYAQERDYTKE